MSRHLIFCYKKSEVCATPTFGHIVSTGFTPTIPDQSINNASCVRVRAFPRYVYGDEEYHKCLGAQKVKS